MPLYPRQPNTWHTARSTNANQPLYQSIILISTSTKKNYTPLSLFLLPSRTHKKGIWLIARRNKRFYSLWKTWNKYFVRFRIENNMLFWRNVCLAVVQRVCVLCRVVTLCVQLVCSRFSGNLSIAVVRIHVQYIACKALKKEPRSVPFVIVNLQCLR